MREGRDGYEYPGKRDRKNADFCRSVFSFISIPFLMLTQIDRIIVPEMKVGHSKSMHIHYFLYYMMIIYAVLRG